MEKQFEEQKEGRRTLGASEIDSTENELNEDDLLDHETKTEIEPDDVDVEQLKEESSEDNIVEEKEDDHETN